MPPGEKPYIKVPNKLKEVIKRHNDNTEQRLRDEQKKVSQLRRVSKAQESIMSEDEKKKRRKMRKVCLTKTVLSYVECIHTQCVGISMKGFSEQNPIWVIFLSV